MLFQPIKNQLNFKFQIQKTKSELLKQLIKAVPIKPICLLCKIKCVQIYSPLFT